MANRSSRKFLHIARPYALAAFEFAREKGQLSEWKIFLETASTIVKNDLVCGLLENPEISSAKLAKLFEEVLGQALNTDRKNFLLLLAQNKRLLALPDITDEFNAHCAALEKMSAVRVITAVETDPEFRQKLTQALVKRIQHEVTLHCEVDPSILGGAIIHIGDRVIDGSIRGKLTRLLEFSLR